MPYCPECRSEYRPGFTRCADCDVELVDRLPAAPSPEKWSEVFCGGFVQADAVRGTLEAAGLETVAPDEYTSNLGWYAPSAIGMARILVREEDRVQALEILKGAPGEAAREPEESSKGPGEESAAVPGDAPESQTNATSGSEMLRAAPLSRLVLRSLLDSFLAVTLPLVAAMPALGHASRTNFFIAILLLHPSLLGMAVWRRRSMMKSGEPVAPLWEGSTIRNMTAGVFVGAFLAGLAFSYLHLIVSLGGPHHDPGPFRETISYSIVLMILWGVVVAPICEEAFYRGVMLGAFSGSGRAGSGVVFSAAIFATMHFNLISLPLYFLDGVVFGALFLKTRSIPSCVIGHATANGLIFMISMA